MTSKESAKLRNEWAAKGNPPCDHSDSIEREYDYYYRCHTDYVCTTCGHCEFTRDAFKIQA